MTDATLSSIAMDVLGQYQQTGANLIRAYRGGSDRFIRGLHARSNKILGASEAADKAAELTIRSLESATDMAARTMTRLANGTAKGIERVGAMSDRLEAKLDETGLHFVRALQHTAANASLDLAGQVTQLSERLSARYADGGTLHAPAPAPKTASAGKKTARRTHRAA